MRIIAYSLFGKSLRQKLPEEYRQLIKRSGAGILSLKNSFLTLPYDGDDSYELSVEQILAMVKPVREVRMISLTMVAF